METEYPSLKLTKKDLQLIKDQQGSQLQEDLDDVMKAIELFVNSKVSQSERICRAKYGKTLLHTHATGIIGMLKALMTVNTASNSSLTGSILTLQWMLYAILLRLHLRYGKSCL